jgi:hypothetical protein
MPTKISTVGVGLLMPRAAAAPFASAERLSPLGPRALFHFSGLGPALMAHPIANIARRRRFMPAERAIQPSGVAVRK